MTQWSVNERRNSGLGSQLVEHSHNLSLSQTVHSYWTWKFHIPKHCNKSGFIAESESVLLTQYDGSKHPH